MHTYHFFLESVVNVNGGLKWATGRCKEGQLARRLRLVRNNTKGAQTITSQSAPFVHSRAYRFQDYPLDASPAMLSALATRFPFASARAVAVAIHFEDVGVVREAMEERAGEALRAEGFSPFVEG